MSINGGQVGRGRQLGEPGRKRELQRIEETRAEGYGIQIVEKAFVSALIRNDGKIVSAYREAFPEEAEKVSEQTMLTRGKGILRRGRVERYMKTVLESKEISPEYVIGGITEVAKGAERDSDKLKAYELLGKVMKLFKVEGGNKTTFNLNINEDTARRLLERRERHEIGGRGDFIDINAGGAEGSSIDGEEESD